MLVGTIINVPFELSSSTGVVSGFFQDGCPNENTGGKLRERESARPQTHLYIQRKPSQMPHFTKIGRYIQLKMKILSNI